MCRLLAFTSHNTTTIPEFVGREFGEFLKLSKVHHDAWGIAIDDGTNTALIKAAETASASDHFSQTINAKSGLGGLLHFRWASPGLPVSDQNAHPFNYRDISFIHNGALSPYDALEQLVAPEFKKLRVGQTDSELFFLYLLGEIEVSGFKDGVIKAIRNVKANFKYSSINSMVMNKDYLIIVSEHDPINKPSWADAYYYELRYRLDDSGIAVASSGWPQEGWNLIANHQIVIVNRNTLQLEVINL